MALGTSAAALAGPWLAPAGATSAESTATCRIDSSSGTAQNSVTIQTTGLAPRTTYDILILARFDGRTFFLDDFPFTTDANGVLVSYPIPAEDPHMEIDWVVYLDTNANGNWDVDEDDTKYRGQGTVTACPQTITLSSK